MHSGLLQTNKSVKIFFLLVAAGLLISSCSYSYYNKYFNQRRYFRLAESQLVKDHDIQSEFETVDTTEISEAVKFHYYRVLDKHRKITREHPDSRFVEHSFYHLIRTYYRLNRWNDVIRTADEYLDQFHSGKYLSLILYYKGLGYLQSGYEDLAMEIFASIDDVEMTGSYTVYFYETTGDIWLRRGSRSNAVKNYRIALKSAEKNEVRFKLSEKIGDVYKDMNMYAVSDSFYVKATKISDIQNVDIFRVYKKHIDNLAERELHQESLYLISQLETDRRFVQFSTELMYIKGIVYISLDEADNAVLVFETALRNRGVSILSDTIVFRGFSQSELGKSDEKIEKEEVEDSKTPGNRNRAIGRENQMVNGIEDVDADKEDANLFENEIIIDIMFELAKIYYKNGDFKRAAMVSRLIIDNNPTYVNIEKCREIVETVEGLENLRATKDEYSESIREFSYKEAEYFLIEINNPDTSMKILNTIIESPEVKKDSLLYQKSLYAISYIHMNQYGDSLKAADFLKSVIEVDPYSVYAKEAAKKLGIDPKFSVQDSLDQDLDRAQRFVINSEFDKAKNEYMHIISKYDTQVMPNVNYAFAGLAYLYEREFFDNDSAFYFYERIVKNSNADSTLANFARERVKNKETIELLLENE